MQSRRSVLQSLAFGTILALSLGGLPVLAEEANEPKRIEFWHAMRGERGVLLEKLTRRFESQNPDIRVTLKAVLDPSPRLANDYAALYRSLLESLANRRPPDVAQLYENWSTQLQEVKALEPLQGELAETIADLQPSLKAGLVAKDGSIFSILSTRACGCSTLITTYSSAASSKHHRRGLSFRLLPESSPRKPAYLAWCFDLGLICFRSSICPKVESFWGATESLSSRAHLASNR